MSVVSQDQAVTRTTNELKVGYSTDLPREVEVETWVVVVVIYATLTPMSHLRTLNEGTEWEESYCKKLVQRNEVAKD
jgi:hypothetical protein